jgi:predicted solute-binding protein
MKYAQGMSKTQALKFIGRYVNKFTLEYGLEGQQALVELFTRASYAGVFTNLKSSSPKSKLSR